MSQEAFFPSYVAEPASGSDRAPAGAPVGWAPPAGAAPVVPALPGGGHGRGRTVTVVLGVVALLAAALVVGLHFGGGSTPAGIPSSVPLQAGECLPALPAGGATERVPCTQPHAAEVFAVLTGGAAVGALSGGAVQGLCTDQVGGYLLGDLPAGVSVSSAAGGGGRTLCLLVAARTGSLRGTGS